MLSPTLKKYKKLIDEMPLLEHSSTSEKRIWEEKEGKKGCKDIVESLFGKKEKCITNSREDVFHYAEQAKKDKTDKAWKKFICATLVWGWPTGSRGRIKSMVNENIKRLIEHLNSIPQHIQIGHWQNTYRKIKDIKGLGPSTYTKFLYFLKVSIDKHRALILDNKLIEVFRRGVFRDFKELKKISRDNAMKKYYTTYLERMHKVGKELKLGTRGAEKLERFLYLFGSEIKIRS